jgi:hypothetical protein
MNNVTDEAKVRQRGDKLFAGRQGIKLRLVAKGGFQDRDGINFFHPENLECSGASGDQKPAFALEDQTVWCYGFMSASVNLQRDGVVIANGFCQQ